MRLPLFFFAAVLPAVLQGQVSGNCAAPFSATVSPGSQLTMDIRSGDLEIVGSAAPGLRITCRMRDEHAASEVRISFAANHLRVHGGPNNDFHIRVEVPEKTGLILRSPAGNLTVSGVAGNKDVELKAGNLMIQIANPGLYKVAEGSVMAGNLSADAFGIVKDGLFRNFRKENPGGIYRLHASVMAGDLILK